MGIYCSLVILTRFLLQGLNPDAETLTFVLCGLGFVFVCFFSFSLSLTISSFLPSFFPLFLFLFEFKVQENKGTEIIFWKFCRMLSQTMDDPVFLLYQDNAPPSFSSLLETTINMKHHRALGHRWVLESTMPLSIKAVGHHTGWSPSQPFTRQPLGMQKSETYIEVSVHSH